MIDARTWVLQHTRACFKPARCAQEDEPGPGDVRGCAPRPDARARPSARHQWQNRAVVAVCGLVTRLPKPWRKERAGRELLHASDRLIVCEATRRRLSRPAGCAFTRAAALTVTPDPCAAVTSACACPLQRRHDPGREHCSWFAVPLLGLAALARRRALFAAAVIARALGAEA